MLLGTPQVFVGQSLLASFATTVGFLVSFFPGFGLILWTAATACQHPHLTVTYRYRWPSAFAGFCFSFSFRSSSLSKRGITCSSRLLHPPVARHCDWHSYTFLILRAQFPNSSSQFIVAYFCLNVVSVQM